MASPSPRQDQSQGRNNSENINGNEEASPSQPSEQNQNQNQNQDQDPALLPNTQAPQAYSSTTTPSTTSPAQEAPTSSQLPPTQPTTFYSEFCNIILPHLSPPECSICMEPYTTLSLLHPCHHFFDYACIQPWILTPLSAFRNPGCPICRGVIEIIERTSPSSSLAVGSTMRCERAGRLEGGTETLLLSEMPRNMLLNDGETSLLSSWRRRSEAYMRGSYEYNYHTARDETDRRMGLIPDGPDWHYAGEENGEGSDHDSGIDLSNTNTGNNDGGEDGDEVADDDTVNNERPIRSQDRFAHNIDLAHNIERRERDYDFVRETLNQLNMIDLLSLPEIRTGSRVSTTELLRQDEALFRFLRNAIATTPLPVFSEGSDGDRIVGSSQETDEDRSGEEVNENE